MEEEDSFTATLEQKASMSDSKLKALLEEVCFCSAFDAVKTLRFNCSLECFGLSHCLLVYLVDGRLAQQD